ncbi:MAG: hypothetical protein BWY86_01154 [Candidatus Aminicenantes bacterium ADurb.Bin508]|nr:MAG: hypothetical protein BWY86_01154 [Candidatus Aminicenantes bacterium ADurb.Bin508]
MGELKKVFGAAFGVSARIDDEREAFVGGKKNGQGGAFDALQGLEDQPSVDHDGAGVSRREEPVGYPLLDELEPHFYGGFLLPSPVVEEGVFHGNEFGRIDDLNPVEVPYPDLFNPFLDQFLWTNQEKF